MSVAVPTLSWGERKRMPTTRTGITHKFELGGFNGIQGYITAGTYEDGSLGELFLAGQKEGSTMAGLINAFCIAFSTALQYGAPVDGLCQKLSGMNFEPNGEVTYGAEEIKEATSVISYICHWLVLRFGSDEAREKMGLT